MSTNNKNFYLLFKYQPNVCVWYPMWIFQSRKWKNNKIIINKCVFVLTCIFMIAVFIVLPLLFAGITLNPLVLLLTNGDHDDDDNDFVGDWILRFIFCFMIVSLIFISWLWVSVCFICLAFFILIFTHFFQFLNSSVFALALRFAVCLSKYWLAYIVDGRWTLLR